MKKLTSRTHFAIYILLCVVLAQGCKNVKTHKEKTHSLTKSDLMIVWENGYLNGQLNAADSVNTWKRDSTAFAVRLQE